MLSQRMEPRKLIESRVKLMKPMDLFCRQGQRKRRREDFPYSALRLWQSVTRNRISVLHSAQVFRLTKLNTAFSGTTEIA